MPPPRTFHWLRFSLRGLFLLWTIAALWLGWNMYVIRQRRALLDDLLASDRLAMITFEEDSAVQGNAAADRFTELGFPLKHRRHSWPRKGERVPLVRRWLGDKPVNLITLEDQAEHATVRKLFPEAAILQVAAGPGRRGATDRGSAHTWSPQ